jgi:hypothetical protein
MVTRLWLRGFVLVLVALMLTLTGVAYAVPPDPSWIPGLYDDDDFDNVVDFITSSAGLAIALVTTELCPVRNRIILLLQPADDVVAFIPLSAFGPRAPPTV